MNQGPVPTIGSPKGTLLYDAVYLASNEKLKTEVGRKALILITDGEDQGSTYDLRTAVQAAQRADAIIYSIYYVDRAFYSGGGFMIGGGGGEGYLRKMSEETGGRVFTVSNKHPLSEVFKQIQDELRNQYSIGYESTNRSAMERSGASTSRLITRITACRRETGITLRRTMRSSAFASAEIFFDGST